MMITTNREEYLIELQDLCKLFGDPQGIEINHTEVVDGEKYLDRFEFVQDGVKKQFYYNYKLDLSLNELRQKSFRKRMVKNHLYMLLSYNEIFEIYIEKYGISIANPANSSYDNLMEKIQDSLYEKKLNHNQISFRYSRGKSHMNGNEIHPYHEILYYMDGDATFLSEKFQEDLEGGTLLLIPKATYHQFYIRNQSKYTRLVLNFPDLEDTEGLLDTTMREIRIIRNPNSHLTGLLERMCQIVSSDSDSKQRCIFLQGAFLMLLAQLNMEDAALSLPLLRKEDQLISGCISYIDHNFHLDLSAENIAKEMNVSVSTLFHSFKKELGITLHRYVTEKRLIHAHKLISEGGKPTKIYLECGYGDYPTFYKAYLKMFGHPPSEDTHN